jgi:rod shape-determining protein MreB
MVVKKSIPVAGDKMNEAIVNHFKRKHNLVIGENIAEDVKIRIGSAFPLDSEEEMDVKGRDMGGGLPKTIRASTEEIRVALAVPIKEIVEAIKNVLEETPAELAADIVDHGIVLSGGGSLVRGLPELLAKETELPVNRAEDPLNCVVKGTGLYLKILNKIGKKVKVKSIVQHL